MTINQPATNPIITSTAAKKPWWQQNKTTESCDAGVLKPGAACPSCLLGTLDFDGLFLLTCNLCKKVAEGGAFT